VHAMMCCLDNKRRRQRS